MLSLRFIKRTVRQMLSGELLGPMINAVKNHPSGKSLLVFVTGHSVHQIVKREFFLNHVPNKGKIRRAFKYITENKIQL